MGLKYGLVSSQSKHAQHGYEPQPRTSRNFRPDVGLVGENLLAFDGELTRAHIEPKTSSSMGLRIISAYPEEPEGDVPSTIVPQKGTGLSLTSNQDIYKKKSSTEKG